MTSWIPAITLINDFRYALRYGGFFYTHPRSLTQTSKKILNKIKLYINFI